MNISKSFRLLAVATVTFALLAGCKSSDAKTGGAGGRGRPGEGGPVPVVVAMVSQRDVPINVDVIGKVAPKMRVRLCHVSRWPIR